jgi:hypothetical protein
VYPQRSSLDGGCSVILSAPQILTSTVSRPILALEREGEENHARHCSSPGPERRSVFPRGPDADADADAQRLSTPHPSPINHRRRKEKNAGGKGGEGDPIPWLGAPRGASSVIRQVMRPWRSKTRMAREALEQFRPRWGRLRAVTVGNG